MSCGDVWMQISVLKGCITGCKNVESRVCGVMVTHWFICQSYISSGIPRGGSQSTQTCLRSYSVKTLRPWRREFCISVNSISANNWTGDETSRATLVPMSFLHWNSLSRVMSRYLTQIPSPVPPFVIFKTPKRRSPVPVCEFLRRYSTHSRLRL